MTKFYAFTDESGSFGWDLDNPQVSTHFIISAIIVSEDHLDVMREKVEIIRKKYFQTGEMKSSKLKRKNPIRRKQIIEELLSLPFSIYSVVFDKSLLINSRGLKYKRSFYKFMNNIVHKELRRAFSNLTIVADEIGGSEYMQSFAKYVSEREDVKNLFGEAEFTFSNSQNDVLIQLADLISGTISLLYDRHKIDESLPDFKSILSSKINRIEVYPKTYETYTVETSALSEEYDAEIANICLKQAVEFIRKYENADDLYRSAQVNILQYLLFRFMNNDLRKYISTKELLGELKGTELKDISIQTFRNRIIGVMRDEGVIISGSSAKKGYKIPATKAELYDFINHDTSIIMPMLARLKKCRDLVKLGTNNALDILDETEYRTLKSIFES